MNSMAPCTSHSWLQLYSFVWVTLTFGKCPPTTTIPILTHPPGNIYSILMSPKAIAHLSGISHKRGLTLIIWLSLSHATLPSRQIFLRLPFCLSFHVISQSPTLCGSCCWRASDHLRPSWSLPLGLWSDSHALDTTGPAPLVVGLTSGSSYFSTASSDTA